MEPFPILLQIRTFHLLLPSAQFSGCLAGALLVSCFPILEEFFHPHPGVKALVYRVDQVTNFLLLHDKPRAELN
jgi:hypothetical protein